MGGMQATRQSGRGRVTGRRTASGLTLLEMLVVFVLASLVGTLLIQGAGFFLGQYDNVKRIGREASSDALQQRWFASTVRGFVPYRAVDRRFVGDAQSFRGVTLAPLRGSSGIPVAARWSIVSGERGTTVVYDEQQTPCRPGLRRADQSRAPTIRSDGGTTGRGQAIQDRGDIACDAGIAAFADVRWTVLESAESLAFEYAGLDRVWRKHWPVEGLRELIPRQVRLATPAGQAIWSASFGLHFMPVANPRDFR